MPWPMAAPNGEYVLKLLGVGLKPVAAPLENMTPPKPVGGMLYAFFASSACASSAFWTSLAD